MSNWLTKIPQRYWAYLALMFWGVLCLMLLHKTPYGIDEGAARVLLLLWSLADEVVSPVVTLGFPDFRAVFLAPIGMLWTGNVLAAKIATMLVVAIAAWSFHAWRQRSGDDEGALLASGLLLISPLMLDQIDTISVGAYLLITYGLGAWTDRMYRESPLAFGGMYFAQLFLCLISVTLHPVGLAYPLALLWVWYKQPVDKKQQKYFLGGIVFVVLLAFALTMGWKHVDAFNNPLKALSALLSGAEDDGSAVTTWLTGIAILLVLAWVLWKQAAQLWSDMLGRTLLFALAIGIFIGDTTFAAIALVTILYWGMPLLLPKPENPDSGFWGQRGVALGVIFLVSTLSMIVDKSHYQLVQSDRLTPRDSLIKSLVEETANLANDATAAQNSAAKKTLRVASQWPGQTMLACRCDVLPLPPLAKDSDGLLAMLKGIDYLIFNPRDPVNSSLSGNLAMMGAGKVDTLALQPGGVIIAIKPAAIVAP